MEIKFEVKMTPKLMYHFMLNHTYRSISGILGVVFGIASFVMFGMTFGKTSETFSVLYLLFGVWFVFYLPLNLYLKSKQQVKKNAVFTKPVSYLVNEEGISVVQEEQKGECKWENIWKACKTGTCIYVYTSPRNAFIFPKEAVGAQYDDLIGMLKKHLSKKKAKL